MRLKYIAAFLVLLGLGCQPADSTTPSNGDGNGTEAPAEGDGNATSSTTDPTADETTLVSFNVTGMK